MIDILKQTCKKVVKKCHTYSKIFFQMSTESLGYENSLRRFALLVVPCLAFSQAFAFGASAPGLAVHQLPTLAAFCVGVQWLGFAHASGLVFGNPRTERFYDLTGSLTFILASYWSSTFIASS